MMSPTSSSRQLPEGTSGTAVPLLQQQNMQQPQQQQSVLVCMCPDARVQAKLIITGRCEHVAAAALKAE
jgi:hypothetical protein